jgi:hemerythrin
MTQNAVPAPVDFAWSDEFLLGYGPMDRTHEEFVSCVRAVLDADDASIAAALAAFAEHAERHFGEEDAWMSETKFPPADCHVGEHAAVMKSVREVQGALSQGAPAALARDLANELVRWFPGHADYLDSALAHWMAKQQYGGKPVVLKRRLALGTAPGP